MSGVFQNIDPPPTRLVERGVGVNILEDARHCSVLYICKYFVTDPNRCTKDAENAYAALVMVPIWGRKRTLADKTVYQNGSIDTNLDPPLFSF